MNVLRDERRASDSIRTNGTRPSRKKDHELRICTWNVRTLYTPGASNLLEKVLMQYRADITAIQEMRWIGSGSLKKRNCDIYYSCHAKHHIFGCGFVIGGKARQNVIGFTPYSERLAAIRIKGKFFNISLLCVHAPTNESDELVKDDFYDALDKAYRACPDHDAKIILGDFNAKIGREQQFVNIVGNHSLHNITTDNGFRLIDLAASRNMVISSTRFPRKNIYKASWLSPDGQTTNQIDHFLIDARYASSVINCRTFRGANIDSDHFLVAAQFRARIANVKKLQNQTKIRYDIGKLKSADKAKTFKEQISTKLRTTPPSLHQSINEQWICIASTIKEVAANTLGYREPPPRNPWYDDECLAKTTEKNDAYRRALHRKTRAAREEYKTKRRDEKKLLRIKKRNFEKSRLLDIESSRDRGEIRAFYRKSKALTKGCKSFTHALRDSEGNVITDASEILKTWKQHFEKLLNGQHIDNDTAHLLTPTNNTEVQLPTLNEVNAAVCKLKNNKAAGSDGLPAELFKAGGEVLVEYLHQIITKIWMEENMPDDWSLSTICPVYKKGDTMSCSNYRGISLLNIAYKILSNILCDRLKPLCNNVIGDYQCGFRPGRSTTDQIFALRQILEKTKEFNVDTHHLFVDFKSAYDTIDREALYNSMRAFNFPGKLIKLSQMTLEHTRCVVLVGKNTSDVFETRTGFRQGDALSCDFFNLVLEHMVRRAGVQIQGNIFFKETQLLGFADDIDIIARSRRALEEAFARIEEEGKNVGLFVNESKTKYMLATNKSATNQHQNTKFGQHNFEVVKEFIYLGANINSKNDINVEVKRRITLANRCYFGLQKQLGSKLLSLTSKVLLYKTLILPVLLYGSESWTLPQTSEQELKTFERKILRKIYGPVNDEGYWRRRYNAELILLYQDVDVIKKIKLKRLQCKVTSSE